MSYLGGRTIYIDSDGNEHFNYERDYEPKPTTNADRIRQMTDEELAMWIAGDVLNLTGGSLEMSAEAWLDWLRQEVLRGYDIDGGGTRYDEEGNVIDYGIAGPSGEPGVKKEATE